MAKNELAPMRRHWIPLDLLVNVLSMEVGDKRIHGDVDVFLYDCICENVRDRYKYNNNWRENVPEHRQQMPQTNYSPHVHQREWRNVTHRHTHTFTRLTRTGCHCRASLYSPHQTTAVAIARTHTSTSTGYAPQPADSPHPWPSDAAKQPVHERHDVGQQRRQR